jgi:hypothetical protein
MSMRNPNLKGGANSQNAYLIDSTEWMRAWVVKLRWLVAAMVLLVVPFMIAQRGHQPPTQSPPTAQPIGNRAGVQEGGVMPTTVLQGSADVPSAMEMRMREQRSVLRQRHLLEKTEQLQKLTDELRAEIDKTDKDTLPVDAVRKSEQIAKLAKNIRQMAVSPP